MAHTEGPAPWSQDGKLASSALKPSEENVGQLWGQTSNPGQQLPGGFTRGQRTQESGVGSTVRSHHRCQKIRPETTGGWEPLYLSDRRDCSS